ncbi:protein kinase domain-containing protein [Henriciella litoralis]|uniref:protein kinase domain-containing protein n=1 Tax=Henriciella litoralis TaxID=568102 RepID=UPI00146F2F1B|nr:protein kinase [Henriciella litoralis]
MSDEQHELEQRALKALDLAFEQPSPDRLAWVEAQYASDPALLSRLRSLLASDTSSQRDLRTGGARDILEYEAIPERAGGYRIDGLIGRGGMGAVYLANRDAGDFDHRVAVKVIRPGVLGPQLVSRFENERRILAKLNHEGIARLFDGGQLEDGSPYIIMEYVDGIPINEWVEQKDLGIDQRLRLFMRVCAAIGHAHQNLIVHRDITPSNVLVNTDGIVKVIDFGIAKPHSQDEPGDETSHSSKSLASLSFTPGFAAPERSRGAAANTLSDVYSLGKLLDAMLDGREIPVDLGSIIDKATQPDPALRYATVSDLSSDVQNYLDHYAVEAHSGGRVYRAGKYLRRHRVFATFATIFVLGLVGAFSLTLLQYQRAEAERQEADQRFSEARQMANFMLFDLFDQLQPIAGNTEPLEKLTTRARTYLDALSKSSRTDRSLELETIKAYHRLANIEGNPISPNLGRREISRSLLKQTEERLAGLYAQYPGDAQVLRELANLKFSQSVFAYIADDDNAQSIAYATAGADYSAKLLESPDATLNDEIQHLEISMYKFKPLIWIDQTEQAVEGYKGLETAFLELERRNPGSEDVEHSVAAFYTSFTEVENWHVYFTGSDPADMIRVADEAVRRMDALSARYPENLGYRRSRALAYYRKGMVYSDLEQLDQAIADQRQALSISALMLEQDEKNAGNREVFNAVQSELMADLSSAEQHDEAIAIGEAMLDTVTADYRREPSDAGYWRQYFQKMQMLGEAYAQAERFETACDYLRQAADSAALFDQEIGISESDRQHVLTSLMAQKTACEEGRTVDILAD